MQNIIFTDLDGTLIDKDSYSFEDAKEALAKISDLKVPMIICTSKTRAEIEFYREKLGNKDPFISENGAAIFIPRGYFDFDFEYDLMTDKYKVIVLGEVYDDILSALNELKQKFKLKGFSDMTPEEISEDCGLPLEEAKLAKQRDYVEPFKILDDTPYEEVAKAIKELGMNTTTGNRYHFIMGGNDKGKATLWLADLFKKQSGKVKTIGFGDSMNDWPMLDVVDKAYYVKADRPDKYEYPGSGPEGWNKAVLKELN